MPVNGGRLGHIFAGEGLVRTTKENVRRELTAYDRYVRGQMNAEHGKHTSLLTDVLAVYLYKLGGGRIGSVTAEARRIRHYLAPWPASLLGHVETVELTAKRRQPAYPRHTAENTERQKPRQVDRGVDRAKWRQVEDDSDWGERGVGSKLES